MVIKVKKGKKRAMYLSDRINQYNDLAWTTKDIRRWLMRGDVNNLEMGDEEMVECHEAISEEFFEYIDLYEKKVAKASKGLHEIIDSSDLSMCS